MPEPRMFFLSGSRNIPSQEIPPGWRGYEIDPENAEQTAEIAPGVRAALLGVGDIILPGQIAAWGARIIVWAADCTVTEWGACRRGEIEPFVSGPDEAAVRRFAADMPNTVTGVVRREVTPWKEAPDA